MCEDTVGSFHCVAMCPETSCCAENKCDCVPSHPPPHPTPRVIAFCRLHKEQLSFCQSVPLFFSLVLSTSALGVFTPMYEHSFYSSRCTLPESIYTPPRVYPRMYGCASDACLPDWMSLLRVCISLFGFG